MDQETVSRTKLTISQRLLWKPKHVAVVECEMCWTASLMVYEDMKFSQRCRWRTKSSATSWRDDW